jgi:hypothetical protein
MAIHFAIVSGALRTESDQFQVMLDVAISFV